MNNMHRILLHAIKKLEGKVCSTCPDKPRMHLGNFFSLKISKKISRKKFHRTFESSGSAECKGLISS